MQAPRAPSAGAAIGPYRVVAELGRGGMGVVYRARHEQTGGECALKVVLAQRLTDAADAERALARFRREAEALGRVDDHPGIVRVFNAGLHEGFPWYAMELVEGQSLAERLRAGPLGPKQAARVAGAIAEAIEHVHRAGLIHRDLKPENVLLGAEGRPRVADFGLAFDALGERLTASGAMLGSPLYMAPEQVESARGTVGPRADVYGLGGLLFACLTGRAPFADRRGMELLKAVLSEKAPDVREHARVPGDLAAVCARALAKEPARRYASAGRMAEDLARFLRGESVVAVTDRTASPVARASLAAGLAVAVALGVAVVVGRGAPSGPPPDEALRALEAALDVGPLDAAGRARARALRDRLSPPDPLASRLELVLALDALAGDLEATADAGRLAALVRPGGRVDPIALRRVESVLDRTMRHDALATVLFGASPLAPPSRTVAARLAMALADSAVPPAAFPLEDAQFEPLALAVADSPGVLAALHVRRGRAFAAADPPALDRALRAFGRALALDGRLPPRTAWTPALLDALDRSVIAAIESGDTVALTERLDLVARAPASPCPLEVALMSRLQSASTELGGVSGGAKDDVRDVEHGLLVVAFLETRGASPLASREVREGMALSVGAERLVDRLEHEMDRPAAVRNPAVLLVLARLLADVARNLERPDRVVERADRAARLALATSAGGERWALQLGSAVFGRAGRVEEAVATAEACYALDRALPVERRWPRAAEALARRLLGAQGTPLGDIVRAGRLVAEACALWLELQPRRRAILDAGGFVPDALGSASDLSDAAHDVATRLAQLGPPQCCATLSAGAAVALMRACGGAIPEQVAEVETAHARAHRSRR